MSTKSATRPRLVRIAWTAAAFLAGLVLRLYFISSHGSWDTEYWKAWASETASAGLTMAYGGPDSVPAGDFVAQLTASKPRHEVSFRGRDFPIDYPPLGLAAWGASWSFFTAKPRPYRGAEAENLAVKFPAVLGDVLAVAVLLFAFRGNPWRALTLAALYWIFPVIWVSSAVLGFFDGFVPPFLLVSVLLLPTSAFLAGAMFALTCLIKPTAAIALPVLFLALPRERWKALTGGGVLITALVALPYLFAGTLETAFIHVVRLFSQERLSGGYANPWWAFGHVASVVHDGVDWSSPVAYARRDAFEAPLGLVGFVGAGVLAGWILWTARALKRMTTAAYVSALLLFVWGLLTVGVHDNHNHPMFLLLAGTGLAVPFVRNFSLVAAITTLLGSICLHGLGRYYGAQWRPILPLADTIARMRMALGFDLTLLLAALNVALLVIALARLRGTIEQLENDA